jgi:Di- and tricarboxylate transporters
MPPRQRELQTIPFISRPVKGGTFFALSISLVPFNYLSPAIAFLLCVLGFARIKIIDSNFYRGIDWPIVVMLAAMIPKGTALQTTGLSSSIAILISEHAAKLSE